MDIHVKGGIIGSVLCAPLSDVSLVNVSVAFDDNALMAIEYPLAGEQLATFLTGIAGREGIKIPA